MKKTLKLEIRRETLRQLRQAGLDEVVAAGDPRCSRHCWIAPRPTDCCVITDYC